MAQRHSTPTLSKSNSATNVSSLEHESSPKNDISCSLTLLSAHRQLKALRGVSYVEKSTKVEAKSISHLERLQHLKMFSRGQSPLQKKDVANLKKQRLDEMLKTRLPYLAKRTFQHHEVVGLLPELNAISSTGDWHIRANSREVIAYSCFGSVFPGLRFKKQGDTYRCVGFSFNIRLAS
ncbi:hypothetical protein [Vibrio sp. TRT 1302]|uniref:hypothetical protein n=1 Tax=Vibrio sp. TRT 1302 TaxID=3418504 RepID=UPI003CEA23DC